MSGASPRDFYMERIPRQWNRALEERESAGPEAARVVEDMKAVDATLKIVVAGEGGGTFFLNVDGGRMCADAEPGRPPFLTLLHDLDAFAALEREAGDSALGFLGGLAGMGGDIVLTRTRLQNLSGLHGALRFELVGEGGFALTTHFGEGTPAEEPACRVSVDVEAYQGLRAGDLNPQDAFMNGQIHVEGDVQMAMQLALAVLSPD